MGGAVFSSHYAASKAAISGFTKSWARELAPHKRRFGEERRNGEHSRPGTWIPNIQLGGYEVAAHIGPRPPTSA